MPNRLAGETSPYLLQHADNPVDWHPWGDEAFARARTEGKPVLLSIGYSACHWCHVMAHESFEDEAIASLMNAGFVNVKVDREERPDVDQIYQTAHALMTRRSGGWPLTVFMTPDGDPFFAGTYFPKDARHGLPGLRELLPHVARVYTEKREVIDAQGEELKRALRSLEPDASVDVLPADARARALESLRTSFDATHGGFGRAPKFPHVPELRLALHSHVAQPSSGALTLVALTATRMAEGGINDQLGGGFCRYSVDAQWQIPHFEKMLYDNGPLLGLYADLWSVTRDATFERAAEGIVAWLAREMRAPDGAFYSSLDADSEGEEGKFYVWQREEVRALLTENEHAVAAAHFGLDGPPNFEGHAWNLRVAQPVQEIAARLALPLREAEARLASARAKLFAARESRTRPGLDDKILTSWNALAISGLARASRRLQRPEWAKLAFDAADALRRTCWRDGRLLATRKGERAHLNAYLDDYAFLLEALDELMQTRFRGEDYTWARAIADALLDRFEDRERGGFFFTSHDHEPLIHRPKPGHDNATPSGNGVAASALIVLGHLAAEPRYLEAAERALRVFATQVDDAPRGFASMIGALDALQAPPAVVLITGDAARSSQWHAKLAARLRVAARIYDVGRQALPAELRKGETSADVEAWICRRMSCLPPMTSIDDVERELDSGG
jgi:uncharacterized protein YyaL (SSP411 family)